MAVFRNPIKQSFFDFLESPDFLEVVALAGGNEALESWTQAPPREDANSLTMEEIARFESCMPMAEHVVDKNLDRSHGGKLYGREDLIQVALTALAKAAVKFQPDRGIKFSSMAYLYMQNAVTSALRKEYHRREHESGYLNKPNEDGNEMVEFIASEDVDDPGSVMERAEMRASLLEQISLLDESEQKVVRMYMDGYSIMQICAAGVVAAPKTTFTSALNKLSRALREEEDLCLS